VFEAERPKLVPYAGWFDGFHAVQASVSKTCLVRFDNNKYSVAASAVGRPVEVHAYADRVVIRQDGRIVAELLSAYFSLNASFFRSTYDSKRRALQLTELLLPSSS
jgi:hypothetical protein